MPPTTGQSASTEPTRVPACRPHCPKSPSGWPRATRHSSGFLPAGFRQGESEMTSEAVTLPKFVAPSEEDELFPLIAGALVGAAAGDALGWITEFVRGREHLKKLYKTDFVTEYRPWQKSTGGRFNTWVDYISKGVYSDDTQLTLATARAIRDAGAFDVEYFSKRELPLWLQYARGAG